MPDLLTTAFCKKKKKKLGRGSLLNRQSRPPDDPVKGVNWSSVEGSDFAHSFTCPLTAKSVQYTHSIQDTYIILTLIYFLTLAVRQVKFQVLLVQLPWAATSRITLGPERQRSWFLDPARCTGWQELCHVLCSAVSFQYIHTSQDNVFSHSHRKHTHTKVITYLEKE